MSKSQTQRDPARKASARLVPQYAALLLPITIIVVS